MPSQLNAVPRLGRPGPHQIPARLVRVLRRPNGARLEFDNDIAVEGPEPDPQSGRPGEEWFIEMPPGVLRAV